MPIPANKKLVRPATAEKTYSSEWISEVHIFAPNKTEGRLALKTVAYDPATGEVNHDVPGSQIVGELWALVADVPEVRAFLDALDAAVPSIQAVIDAQEAAKKEAQAKKEAKAKDLERARQTLAQATRAAHAPDPAPDTE